MAGVVSTAPDHIRTRYMRGGCWAMASELSRVTGLDLWGVRDEAGDLHHVFVADPDADLAIDIRGSMKMDRVADGCVGSLIGPASHEEMFRHIGSLDRADVSEARRILREYLQNLPKKRRKTPAMIATDEEPGPC